ncbi:MAG TPA: methyltransferase [Roseiflexaceae bacterium]|nr:methyltransferase [Roseiflexaceae bacterium]
MRANDPAIPYPQPREIAARLAGRAVRVVTKPGFPGWERVSAAQQLLAEHVEARGGERACLIGCGHAAVGAALALAVPGLRLALLDQSVVALAMAGRTLAANGVAGAALEERVSLLPGAAGAFDLVVLETPPNRQLARRWLVEAHGLLRPGGRLYLAGMNDQGIQSVIADAGALFGGATQLGYGGRARVAVAERGETGVAPPWAAAPGIAPGTWHELTVEVGGERLALRSLPGVFSYNRLDDGTRLLLEHMPPSGGKRVLDAGCGYGVIGIVAARRGAAAVDMVDASTLALAAARQNIRLHGLQAANVLPSDGLQAVARRSYDLVLSNPPFHAGKAVDYDVAHVFIEQARLLLAPGGRLALVANRFIRYDQIMQGLFEHVETLAQTRSFHVLAGSVA